MKRVGIFYIEVCVQQLVRILVRIGCGRRGAAEMNCVVVARHDGVDGWILPRPQTLEAELFFVVGKRAGNVGSEEQGYDLPNHGHSVRQRLRDDRRRCRGPQLPGTAKEQNVAIGVADLETAQTVVRVLERLAEGCAMVGKFGGKSIGFRRINKCVPSHVAMPLRIREGRDIFVGFDQDLGSVAADNTEKRILIGLSESRLKTKISAIESDGLIDVADDEAG